MDPLISIIIPVYDVEKYLHKCVDSVLAQTYRNIEVILVDDGSPDGCPGICDVYGKKDRRVKVIHKVNGGLSDARNEGLDIARGEFIAFVDSDDFISPRMIEMLYISLYKNSADIAICGVSDIYEDVPQGVLSSENYIREKKIISGELATEYILEDAVIVAHAWDKLYKAGLFKNIRFPIGKRFEDMYVTHQVIQRAQRVVLIPDILYTYVHRSTSISYTKMAQNCYDICGAYLSRLKFAKKNCPQKYDTVLKQAVTACVDLYNMKLHSPKEDVNVSFIRPFLQEHIQEIQQSALISKKFKLFSYGIVYTPFCHNQLYKVLARIRGNGRQQ